MNVQENHFDIIVVGAGSGGLNIAGFMNRAGFKVLLISKTDKDIGGDCLNTGCVPSKSLIHVARTIQYAKEASLFGVFPSGMPDGKKVRDFIVRAQDTIRTHESAEYFRSIGMTVVLGTAQFTGKQRVSVNGVEYSAKRIVLATGSKPRMIDISGSEYCPIYTSDTIFSLDTIPKRLVVVGGGPIGLELGQAYAMLGSGVHIVSHDDRVLPREEASVSGILHEALQEHGMHFYFNSEVSHITEDSAVVVKGKDGTMTIIDATSAVLLAIGRDVYTDGLMLDTAGIQKDEMGKLVVNEYLQTTNPHVYACGDVAGLHQFTHAAEVHAGIILRNFFAPFKKKLDRTRMNWITFTTPEVATFGLQRKSIELKHIPYEVLEKYFDTDDRAIIDTNTHGKVVLFVSHDKKILGGSVIGNEAGSIAEELMLLESQQRPLDDLFKKVYPYPSKGRINKGLVSEYMARQFTVLKKRILHILY